MCVRATVNTFNKNAAFDSWLTIGITTGNSNNAISSIGLVFSKWTIKTGIQTKDGAVFYMNPNLGPSQRKVVIAQLTIAKTALPSFSALANFAGRTASYKNAAHVGKGDYHQLGVVFKK